MTDWKELEVLDGITYHKYPDEPVNGVVEYHYKNGQQNIRKSYKDGKRDGLSEKYHNNGQLHWRANYKNGKLDGLWEEFDKDGNPIRDKEFQDGKLTRGTTIKSDNKHLSLNEQYYRDELF